VIEWITDWVGRRRNARLRRDGAGNLVITRSGPPQGRPVFITAHLDHPAFVVRRVVDEQTLEAEFRGGVLDPYFPDARLDIFDGSGERHRGVVTRFEPAAKPYKRVTVRLSRPAELRRGDLGRWSFRGRGRSPTVVGGRLHAPACDDLAGVAAALSAFDVLRSDRGAGRAGVLLTRAEELGFIGAIAACKRRTVSKRARLICLECSRSFPDSPIGAGPILRVGDRLSVFSPELTNRLGLLLTEYQKRHPRFKAQRKLMPGGACEATTFSAYGYEACCVCLPLGNYHNMVDIDGVVAGKRPARMGPEVIAMADYHGMIELLVHFARRLDAARTSAIVDRMEDIFRRYGRVLEA
jgi:endoglucanase